MPAAVLLIVAVGVCAYANSFHAPFVFDGSTYLVHELVKLESPSLLEVLQRGQTRPLVFLTFYLEYVVGGKRITQPDAGPIRFVGFHVVNLAIHIAAALALFGIVHRTLASPRLSKSFASRALPLALAAALIWVAHPLQTESVTYLYQRYESMFGLGVLLTLYCFIVGTTAKHPARWYVASAVCCTLATLSKEVAAVTPLLVLWYDRVFVAASWRELFQSRWSYYLALAANWPLLMWLMSGIEADLVRAGVLFVPGVTAWDYAKTQPEVILHYLRLVFWPAGQSIDYHWQVAEDWRRIVAAGTVLLGLLAATVWCMWRRPALGFLFGSFFLILGPTSSFAPLKDLAFEHRMYLPLAAVVLAALLAGDALSRWAFARWPSFTPQRTAITAGMMTVVVVVCCGLTLNRNRVYQTEQALWEDVLAKGPDNARAHSNLGKELFLGGDIPRAMAEFEEAIRLQPAYPQAYYNLALCHSRLGRHEKALADLEAAIRHAPHLEVAWFDRGNELRELRRLDEAEASFTRAVEIAPQYSDAFLNRGAVRFQLGRVAEALDDFNESLRLAPTNVLAYKNRAAILESQGRLSEALTDLNAALTLQQREAAIYRQRALVLSRLGRRDLAYNDAATFVQLGGEPDAELLKLLPTSSGSTPIR